jgi:hypothetical protein
VVIFSQPKKEKVAWVSSLYGLSLLFQIFFSNSGPPFGVNQWFWQTKSVVAKLTFCLSHLSGSSLHVCMSLFCTTILHISKLSSYITYLCVCVEQYTLLSNPFRSNSCRRFSWVWLFVEKGKLVNILLLFPHSFLTQCTTGMSWGS